MDRTYAHAQMYMVVCFSLPRNTWLTRGDTLFVVSPDIKMFTQGHQTCEALFTHVNGRPAALIKQISIMLKGLDEHQGMLHCVTYRWHDQVSDRVLQHCGHPHVQGHGGSLPGCTANARRSHCQPDTMGAER